MCSRRVDIPFRGDIIKREVRDTSERLDEAAAVCEFGNAQGWSVHIGSHGAIDHLCFKYVVLEDTAHSLVHFP